MATSERKNDPRIDPATGEYRVVAPADLKSVTDKITQYRAQAGHAPGLVTISTFAGGAR